MTDHRDALAEAKAHAAYWEQSCARQADISRDLNEALAERTRELEAERQHATLALASVAKMVQERTQDRAAIRDMADVMALFLHPGEPDCLACEVAKKHAAAIARAQETP